jgi:hypothetical protein
MKHTHETLLNATNYLLPKIAKAKENGVNFNLPSLLSMIAEDFFVSSLNYEWNPKFEERVAYFICQEALYDLKTVGMFEFGTQEFDFVKGV